MHDLPCPHDLLWGMTPAQLPADAPEWVLPVLATGQPVVVRRAMVASGQIAVGVRGATRDQRYATVMSADSVRRSVRPEALVEHIPVSGLRALLALAQLKPALDELGMVWGVTGSVGYQLATGVPVAHAESDLDLLVRAPQPFSRSRAHELLRQLDGAPCCVDLQLETPAGAIALREWAGSSDRVLLKCPTGARLVTDPWDRAEQAA